MQSNDQNIHPFVSPSLQLETIKGIKFTTREIDVIASLINGNTTKRMSALLNISPRTVETHIRNVMHKLECNSQEQIIDFVEKSECFLLIRKHYLNLLLQVEFDKCAHEILKIVGQKPRLCKVVYFDEGPELKALIHEIEKSLETFGFKVKFTLKAKSNHPGQISSSSERFDERHLLYIMPKEFQEKLTLSPDDAAREINDISTSHRDSFDSLLFILNAKEPIASCPSLDNERFLNIADYESYHFVALEILAFFFQYENLETILSRFKQHYERLDVNSNNIGRSFSPAENSENRSLKSSYIPSLSSKVWMSISLICFSGIAVPLYIFWQPLRQGVTLKEASLQSNHQTDQLPTQGLSNIGSPKNNTSPIFSWNLPFPNLYFTGRTEELKKISSEFEAFDQRGESVAVIVCTGLSGVGKTEIAKDYTHNWKKYTQTNYTTRVWFNAERLDMLLESYSKFGQKIGITTKDMSPDIIIENVKTWFEAHPKWLIIYDNAENFDALVNFFPQSGGHILITSRHKHWPNTIEVDSMNDADSLILLNKIIKYRDNLEDRKLLVKTLEGIPIAITQAGAYIVQNGKRIKTYLHEYEEESQKRLEDTSTLPGAYHSPPSVTWNISLNNIKVEYLVAYNLINMLVYICPDNIPVDDLFRLFPEYKQKHKAQHMIDKAIQVLLNHGMIKFNSQNNTISLHRLVQEVMWYRQGKEHMQENWLGKVLDVVVDDKDDHFVFGGIATHKNVLKKVIHHYEHMPESKRTPLLYQSLGCCYLVENNFPKAEESFIKGIHKGGNSSIHYEYAQALYLNNQLDDALKQLKLSIDHSSDNLYSYFGEMEKETVPDILKKEILRIGTVRIKSSQLAYYLLLKILLQKNNHVDFNSFFKIFSTIAESEKNPLLAILLSDLTSQSKHFHAMKDMSPVAALNEKKIL